MDRFQAARYMRIPSRVRGDSPLMGFLEGWMVAFPLPHAEIYRIGIASPDGILSPPPPRARG